MRILTEYPLVKARSKNHREKKQQKIREIKRLMLPLTIVEEDCDPGDSDTLSLMGRGIALLLTTRFLINN